jgi:hypothetical protein
MKKNVASQRIGAQLVSASDGSAFTGSVTVSVTGDAGTQAIGSVGSGACTHEGNGYHTYAPAQAETNYDLIAFTFTASGAVPVTVQVYTRPTTGLLAPTVDGRTLDVSAAGEAGIDWANIGSPTTTVAFTGTTIATTQKVDVETIKTQAVTCAAGVTVPSSIASPTNITGGTITTVGSVTGAVGSVTGNVGGNVTGSVASVVGAVTVGTINANVVNASALASDAVAEIQSGLATAANLATVAGYLDTEVAAILVIANKLDTAMVLDGAVYQFTSNALELGPSGSGGTSDWTTDERAAIRTILGVPASGTTPDAPSAGALKVIDDLIDTEITTLSTAVADLPTNAELATALASSDDATLAAISGLNNLSAAQVNAEVLDVLNVDTFAELSSVPAATSSLRAKLTWLFMWARNKSTQTSTQRKLYLDDGTTVVGTEAVSDDGTTYTKGEVA